MLALLVPLQPDGTVRACHFLQVLEEVGMDASAAEELMAAASGPDTGAEPRASRSISFEHFHRMLTAQPPSIITQARKGWMG